MNNYFLPFDIKEEDGPNQVIEFGGGAMPIFHPNVDVRDCPGVDIVGDLDEPLNIPSESYKFAFSKFAVEHISYRKTNQFLLEVFRILKPGGKFVFIIPNTLAQIYWVSERVEQGIYDEHNSCILYGGADYDDNFHKSFFSPGSIIATLQELNFENILVLPFGEELWTDMIVECTKPETKLEEEKMANNDKQVEIKLTRKEMFDKHYFNGGQKVGGYAHEGFRDFTVHHLTFNKLMSLKPESVLEVGCGRGYLVKRFQDNGILADGLEISHHCWMTRACDNVVEWDVCEFPWPIPDKSYDLCYSVATLEHIPEEFVPGVLKEMERVSKRGIHGIDFGGNDDGFDKTHCTLRSREWWLERMPQGQQAIDKEDLERCEGLLHDQIPAGDGKLKINLGCYLTQFHYGWTNIDGLDLREWSKHNLYKFYQADLRHGLPFLQDNSVDLAYSSHCLEHMTYGEGEALIKECFRVMKPGATFRIMLPDAELLTKYYKDANLDHFNEINDPSAEAASQAAKFCKLLFEGHFAAYDWETLKTVGEKLGFQVERRKFRDGHEQILTETIDMQPELSIYVEFIKP